MMILIRVILLSLAILCAGCSKDDKNGNVIEIDLEFPSENTVRSQFAPSFEETGVSSVQILVFKEHGGMLCSYTRAASLPLPPIRLLSGDGIIVFAVVNGPDLSAVTYYNQLGSIEVDANSSASSLLTACRHIEKATGAMQLTMQLERRIARIDLEELRAELPDWMNEIEVTQVRIANAASSAFISGNGRDHEQVEPEVHASLKLANHSDMKNPIRLYCFPPEGNISSSIIVRIRIGGSSYDLSAELGQLEMNTAYKVRLTLRSLGGADNEITVSSARWVDSIEYSETI